MTRVEGEVVTIGRAWEGTTRVTGGGAISGAGGWGLGDLELAIRGELTNLSLLFVTCCSACDMIAGFDAMLLTDTLVCGLPKFGDEFEKGGVRGLGFGVLSGILMPEALHSRISIFC